MSADASLGLADAAAPLQPPPAAALQMLAQKADNDDGDHIVVETDPSGRYERTAEALGHGAYKDVYKAFDTEEGVEVAWNQFRLDHLSARDASRILSEIRILQSLRHENVINMYDCWSVAGPDGRERVYFVTELMTSGTLKSFVRRTKGPVRPKVLKNWCRQILLGLYYLHSRSPPIIHRDLKCENIFINGNNGQAKIGDLGLACVKSSAPTSSVLGTPEFMAPELYDEHYDEKVDIYAFGMVILEIANKEYPYAECTNQAQIYKKVSSGQWPNALQRVTDPETRQFIELCIQMDPARRPSAAELLQHPFLIVAPTLASGPGAVAPSPILNARAPGAPAAAGFTAATGASNSAASSVTSSSPPPGHAVAGMPAQAPAAAGATRSGSASSVGSAGSLGPAAPQAAPLGVAQPQREFCSVSDYPYPEQCQITLTAKDAPHEFDVRMSYVNMNDPLEAQAAQCITFTFDSSHDTPAQVVAEMVREGLIDQVWEQRASRNLAHVVQQAQRAASATFAVPAKAGPLEGLNDSGGVRVQTAPLAGRKNESGYYSASADSAPVS